MAVASVQAARSSAARPMSVRLQIYFLIALAVAVFGSLLALSVLSYNGLCIDQRRFLSDREFFDAAIREVSRKSIVQRFVGVDDAPRTEPISVVPYSNLSEFKAANPDCCSFVPISGFTDQVSPASFSDRLFGRVARAVRVRFQLRPAGGGAPLTSTQFLKLTNCGSIWNPR